MDTSSAPSCPECGFRIYNRRYPNCESCGAALPETLVYSESERLMLKVEEDERSLEKARLDGERDRHVADDPFSVTSPGALDDAVLSSVTELTNR